MNSRAFLFCLLLVGSALVVEVFGAGDDRICCSHDNDDDNLGDDDNDGVDFARESWYLYIPSDVNIECHREILTQAENAHPDLTGYAFEANGCHIPVTSCTSVTGNLAGAGVWCFQSTNDDDYGFGANDFVSPISDAIDTTTSCGSSYTVIRTWRSSTSCVGGGNQIGSTQTIRVVDTTPPELNVPQDITVECEPTVNTLGQSNDELFGRATVTDLCNQPATIAEVVTLGGSTCSATITRDFTADDGCFQSTGRQVVTIVDTTPPVIEHFQTIFIPCENSLPAVGITAYDTCQDQFITASAAGDTTYPGACTGEYTVERVYTATDNCGNSATHTQLFVVEDNDPPTILPPPNVVRYSICQPLDAPLTVYTATDACGGPATIDVSEPMFTGGVKESGLFSVVRTITAADDCGNTAVGEEIIIVEDVESFRFDVDTAVAATLGAPFNVPYTYISFACPISGQLVISYSPLTFDFSGGAGVFCTPSGEGVAICPLQTFPSGSDVFSFVLEDYSPGLSSTVIDFKFQLELTILSLSADIQNTRTHVVFV